VASSRHNEIDVALQIVVSGDEISRVAPDGCFQDFVIIGIATCPQITGGRGHGRPSHDKPEECFGFLREIAKSSGQTRTPKDIGNFGKLGERCNSLKVSL
jgi:hypothetical protein